MDAIIITWMARALLVVIILGLIYFFTTRRNKYEYEGITRYKRPVLSGIADRFRKRLGFDSRPKSPKRVNKTENLCRKIIEGIYSKPFPSVRPDFLKNPRTGKNLELDCYNEQLQIALEYNGAQHYTYSPHFHGTKDKFYKQVHSDDYKRKICQERGIRLVEVPSWVSPPDLRDYIIRELKKKGCL